MRNVLNSVTTIGKPLDIPAMKGGASAAPATVRGRRFDQAETRTELGPKWPLPARFVLIVGSATLLWGLIFRAIGIF